MRTTAKLGDLVGAAQRNHGLLTAGDLRAGGISGEQASALVHDRALERIVRGLYRLPGTRTPTQDIAAAVSRHHGAAASHRSGLWLHDLSLRRPGPPDITLPPGSTSRTSLGRLHRSPLSAIDTTTVAGIAVTAIPRTVVDVAEFLDLERLHDLVAEVVVSRRAPVGAIGDAAERVERQPGRLGLGRLREVLGAWTDALRPESIAEAAMLRRILDAGLPAPETQFEVRDRRGRLVARVDLAWPGHRVVREYDSDRHHAPHRAEVDERRRRSIEAEGWRVGVLHRGHLAPGREDWLRLLARDLGLAVRA